MAFMEAPKAAGEGGDFTPILSYNAKAGRLFLINREQQSDGGWDTNKIDVTMSQPAFAVDFGRLEVGWVHFTVGGAPQWHMVAYGNPPPPKPASPGSDEKGKALQFRNGFRLPVAGNAIGGVREFAGNSAAMINGMNDLHTAYEIAPEASAGKIPVVKLVNVVEVKSGQGSSFQPVFAIQAWVDRPDVLGPRTVPAPRAVNGHAGYSAAPPGTPAAVVHVPQQGQNGVAPAAMPF